MVVRRRNSTPQWHMGFIGDGEVTEENATELLDVWLPSNEDGENEFDYFAYLPSSIRRTQKGLKAVSSALDTLGLDVNTVADDAEMVRSLVNTADLGKNAQVYLIVLWDDSEELAALVEKAITGGVKVKDLCAALDDVELAEPEPEPPAETKRRGKPRATNEDVVDITVEGPATLTPHATGAIPDGGSIGLLYRAIKAIVHEEVQAMGLSIGHNTRQQHSEQDEKVRAFVDDDGNYELAGEKKRAPRGKKSVELTKDEADQLGLTEE